MRPALNVNCTRGVNSRVSLSIMLIGKLFQSMMVRGKKIFEKYVVDEDGGI